MKNYLVKRSIFKDGFDLKGLKIPVTKHIRAQMFQIVLVLLESMSYFTKSVKQYVTIQ